MSAAPSLRLIRLAEFTLCLACLPASPSAHAEPWRDPTRPPEAMRPPNALRESASAGPASAGASAEGEQEAPLRHRMVIAGKPYLVERGWLRGVGEKLGDATIERITETEVWLRDANGLHKQALYPQVQIRPAAAPSAATKPARSSTAKDGHPP